MLLLCSGICACSFFFSSRRRHTRLQGDWSSDVCSSDLIAARVEANYARIVTDLGAPSVARVTVFLYRDFASLQAAVHTIAGTLPTFATGLVTNAATIHLLSPNLSTTWSYADAVRAIVHEFAHCVSLVVNPSIANNPRWLWETVAVYEANDFVDPRMLPGMVAGTPPTVTRLNSFDNVDVYRVGYTIGEFIVARWGREGLAALIRNNGNTSQTTGLSLAQFLDEWYAFVRQRYL